MGPIDFLMRSLAAVILLVPAACGRRASREPPPPLTPPQAMMSRQAPVAEPLAPGPVPDPTTGLPPGWYVPEPPPMAEPGSAPQTGVTVPLTPAESVPRRTSPELRTRALLRDFPWISGFWAELAPAERARAERAFARRGERDGLAARWDRMGLGERVVLLFGAGRAG
jgi:hypothetical protein